MILSFRCKLNRISFHPLLLAGIFLLLAGCAPSLRLTVESEIPSPLTVQTPLAVGIYYDEAFRHYVYEENSEERRNWRIESGAAHVAMFDRILPSMFRSVTHVGKIPVADDPSGLDGVISPRVEEMQFALPKETQTDFYEAWIKYTIRLYNPAGELIGEWPVIGYGRTATEFLKDEKEGLNFAINLALRDAGAKLALGLEKRTEVRERPVPAAGD